MPEKYKAGDIVEELTLIEKIPNRTADGRSRPKWRCLCSCGKETTVLASNLGKTRSCGHLTKESVSKSHFKDLSCERFGKLFVVKRADDRIGKSGRRVVQYLCLCDCGNTAIVDAQELRKGATISCGCFQKENNGVKLCKIHVGDVFGKLTVIGKEQSLHYGRSTMSRWKCKCECGSETIVFGGALRRGQVSCGCVNSKGEEEIAKYLSENNIEFKRQYYFDDLVSDKGFPVFFDFAICENNEVKCLIEYQGIQHFVPQANHFGDHQREVTDVLKKEYCAKNNIALYEIRYNEDISEALVKILAQPMTTPCRDSEKSKV